MDRTAATSLGPVVTPLRCTVYARTSSHEAVDQAYTSLDAQRDAGLAYIASQAGVGWQATGTTYYLARVGITAEGHKKLGPRRLQPGMPVEVVFLTGERSLLTYLLKPLTKRLAASMTEE